LKSGKVINQPICNVFGTFFFAFYIFFFKEDKNTLNPSSQKYLNIEINKLPNFLL